MPQERATRLHLPANIALSERARQTPVCLNALRFLSDLVTTLGKKNQTVVVSLQAWSINASKMPQEFCLYPTKISHLKIGGAY